MANRHLSRSLAMQALFEWDFNERKNDRVEDSIFRIVQEFGPGLDELDFIQELVLGVIKYQDKLDDIIEKAAPDWPIHQIAVVDRNVLRIGLFELLFGDKKEVPARVAINESIELAKTFGGENSGRFVNGVLGTIYKELGEPGKDEMPAKKKRPKDVTYEEMPIEKLGGAVVYRQTDAGFELALVHDVFGYWTLSKGHIEANENEKECTAREIKEETGLVVTGARLFRVSEAISEPLYLDGQHHLILIDFLANVRDLNVELDHREFSEYQLAPLRDALNLNLTPPTRGTLKQLLSAPHQLEFIRV